MQHALNLHRGDRGALDGRQQHAAQRVANGGTESTFKRLCPEMTVFVGQGFVVSGKPFRFLKTLPKHLLLLLSVRPCCTADPQRSRAG